MAAPTFLPVRAFVQQVTEAVTAELALAADNPIKLLLTTLPALSAALPRPREEGAEVDQIELLDIIGVTTWSVHSLGDRLQFDAVLAIMPGFEPELPVPGLNAAFVLRQLGSAHFSIGLESLHLVLHGPGIALRLPHSVARPVGGGVDDHAEIEIVEIGSFLIDHTGTWEIVGLSGGEARFVTNNDPWDIAGTGVTLETGDISIVFDPNEGGPALAFSDALVRLPESITGENGGFAVAMPEARIDRRGFSGSVEAMFSPVVDNAAAPTRYQGLGAASLVGFEIGLQSVAISFLENIPVRIEARAGLLLPFFNKPIGALIAVGADRSLRLMLEAAAGEATAANENLELGITKLDLQIGPQGSYLSIDGTLRVLQLPAGIQGPLPSLTIAGLKLDGSGKLTLQSAWLDLSPPIALDLWGFVATLSRMGIGIGIEPASTWIALSGGVTLANGLPSAGVEDLRLTLRPGQLPLVSISGLALDARIGEEIRVFGALHKQAPPTEGFGGDVALQFASLGAGIEAFLLAGVDPIERYGYLYVAAGVDLPGIPIGTTGLSLFGFQGLLGFNVAPTKTADEHWYTDWYLGPPGPGSTQAQKWTNRRDGLALGAGITLGTNDGNTLSARGLLVITLPQLLVMLEGRAAILTNRAKLGENPPFKMLAVYDPADGILLDIEAAYEVVPEILFVQGVLEAFFPFEQTPPKQWYVHVGTDEKPVVGQVIKRLFNADAYLMANSAQTRMGGGIRYGVKKKFGPARVEARARLRGEGAVSYSPDQFRGHLDLGGTLELRAFGIGVNLKLHADIDIEVPTPFELSLEFEATLNVPWPGDDVSVSFDIVWEEASTPPYPDLHLQTSAAHPVTNEIIALANAKNVPVLPAVPPTIPIDARLSISFAHAIATNEFDAFARLLGFTETPGHYVSASRTFRYNLTRLVIERLENDVVVETLTASADGRLFGHWQRDPGVEADARSPASRLVLFARTPADSLRESTLERPTNPPDYNSPTAPKIVSIRLSLAKYVQVLHAGETGDGPETCVAGVHVIADGIQLVVLGLARRGQDRLEAMTDAEISAELVFASDVFLDVLDLDSSPAGKRTIWLAGSEVEDRPGVRADRVTVRGHTILLGGLLFRWAREADDAARINAVAAYRERLREAYPSQALAALDEVFLFRPESSYRLRYAISKSGRSDPENEMLTIPFSTGPAPTDLQPYVLFCVPANARVPMFRRDVLAVRFRVPYLQYLFDELVPSDLTLDLRSANGISTTIACAWRDAENHIDIEGTGSFLDALEEAFAVSGAIELPKDNILIATPAASGLPASSTFDARLMRTGQVEPLYQFRFVTSRFADHAEWVAAFSGELSTWTVALAAEIFEPGPDDTLSIADVRILPLLADRLPTTPRVRRIDGFDALVVDTPEPLAFEHLRFVLRSTVNAPVAPAATCAVMMEREPLVPIVASVTWHSGSVAAPIALANAHLGRPRELDSIPSGAALTVRARWLEDGTRCILVVDGGVPAGPLDLEVQRAGVIPSTAGNLLVESATVRLQPA